MTTASALPFIDEHRVHVAASAERTWAALRTIVVDRLASRPAPATFVALWHLEPRSGFAVAEEAMPSHLALRGHHRFSRYELAFEIDEADDGVTLRARTSAVFPGIAGWIYRLLVIGTGGHTIVANRMLKKIARRAERAPGRRSG